MPVHPAGKSGKGKCYQYGHKGKKYCGSGAKSKANKQARAIRASQARRGKPVK